MFHYIKHPLTLIKIERWNQEGREGNITYTSKRGPIQMHVEGHHVREQTMLDSIHCNPTMRHHAEQVFQPHRNALVQWICVLKTKIPLYAMVGNGGALPMEVFQYMNN